MFFTPSDSGKCLICQAAGSLNDDLCACRDIAQLLIGHGCYHIVLHPISQPYRHY
jgi:hypothetical protein